MAEKKSSIFRVEIGNLERCYQLYYLLISQIVVFSYRNVVKFLEEDLPSIPRRDSESHLVCYQHGDLNMSNILIDDSQNVWLIDFAVRLILFLHHAFCWYTKNVFIHKQDTGLGHILKDVSKLESDALYCYTPIENDDDVAEGLVITNFLLNIRY